MFILIWIKIYTSFTNNLVFKYYCVNVVTIRNSRCNSIVYKTYTNKHTLQHEVTSRQIISQVMKMSGKIRAAFKFNLVFPRKGNFISLVRINKSASAFFLHKEISCASRSRLPWHHRNLNLQEYIKTFTVLFNFWPLYILFLEIRCVL